MGLTGNLYLGMKYERQAAPSDSFTVTGQLTAFYAGEASLPPLPGHWKIISLREPVGGVITVGQLITTKVKSGLGLLPPIGRLSVTPAERTSHSEQSEL